MVENLFFIFVFCIEIKATESNDIINIFCRSKKDRKSILAHCKANNVDGNKHINLEFFANISWQVWLMHIRSFVHFLHFRMTGWGQKLFGTFWLLNNVFFLPVYHFLITFLVLKMTEPDKKDKNWFGEKVHCLTMT